ncbi:MAG: hypothetical protein ABI718_05925, partial [Acidobacteriota bacterium]
RRLPGVWTGGVPRRPPPEPRRLEAADPDGRMPSLHIRHDHLGATPSKRLDGRRPAPPSPEPRRLEAADPDGRMQSLHERRIL